MFSSGNLTYLNQRTELLSFWGDRSSEKKKKTILKKFTQKIVQNCFFFPPLAVSQTYNLVFEACPDFTWH